MAVPFARSLQDTIDNLLTLIQVKIRLQICPGLPDTLGIANAEWAVLLDGKKVVSGKTAADGEILLLMHPADKLTLRVFDTDYAIVIAPPYAAVNTIAGTQKRLDTLGYVTGHLLKARGNARADDGLDGPMTRQSLLNFQCDETLTHSSTMDNATTTKLTARAGA